MSKHPLRDRLRITTDKTVRQDLEDSLVHQELTGLRRDVDAMTEVIAELAQAVTASVEGLARNQSHLIAHVHDVLQVLHRAARIGMERAAPDEALPSEERAGESGAPGPASGRKVQ